MDKPNESQSSGEADKPGEKKLMSECCLADFPPSIEERWIVGRYMRRQRFLQENPPLMPLG